MTGSVCVDCKVFGYGGVVLLCKIMSTISMHTHLLQLFDVSFTVPLHYQVGPRSNIPMSLFVISIPWPI